MKLTTKLLCIIISLLIVNTCTLDIELDLPFEVNSDFENFESQKDLSENQDEIKSPR